MAASNSSSRPSGSGENVSLFDVAAAGTDEPPDADRVQALKQLLFDLAYLVMNADGTEHISEKMLIRKLEHRMEREGSVDVDARADALNSILDDGSDAIRQKVQALAQRVAERAGDRTQAIGDGYLDLLKGLIVADARVAPEEYELFEVLCDVWEVEKDLP